LSDGLGLGFPLRFGLHLFDLAAIVLKILALKKLSLYASPDTQAL